jgi:hypothetical protein
MQGYQDCSYGLIDTGQMFSNLQAGLLAFLPGKSYIED